MTRDPAPRRRVSLTDVAREAGVSATAASFALNGRSGVGEVVRARVKEAAARLGYVPSTSAVALRTGRSGAVGLLIRNMRNPFFLDVIDGFDATCAAAGLGVVIGSADYSPAREAELVATLAARGVDGLALAPIGGGSAAADWDGSTGKPVVLINGARHAPGIDASRVHVDGEAAVAQAMAHLAELGHQRIAIVAAPRARSADDERVAAFHRICAERGLAPRVIETAMQHDAAVRALTRALAEPAATRPTAIVTSSDYLATAVYSAAASTGLRIGVDVSVVGHDDLGTSRFLAPALTTIAVDRAALGAAAARRLIERLDGGGAGTTVVPTELVARASTGPAPAGGSA
ncbi:LacI family DNA-binding transcriptional regulator [Clavibacter nebraskensis]|uniref:LacI family DNA-binding transcriptional regulator n=1 Tax=Clavibacter nebraskensis TaxID=31963 RepID=UPI003F87D317